MLGMSLGNGNLKMKKKIMMMAMGSHLNSALGHLII